MSGAGRYGFCERRPIVKRGGVEVRAVRPNQCIDHRIDSHCVEDRQVPQRTKKLAREHWLKIGHLFSPIVESDAQDVRRFDPKRADSVQ